MPRQIPKCLLAAAKTIPNRLVVVNAWLSQDSSSMQRWAQDLKQFYLCVSRFSDEAYTRAAVFPTVYDKKRIRDEAWEETDRSKVL
mmetsp:Transcript_14797/g.26752  ORF Transcript_14797/g.26752 Transcript_14797/m.26752 type:complete len:86 (+) Transcript_14797:401-658(+)